MASNSTPRKRKSDDELDESQSKKSNFNSKTDYNFDDNETSDEEIAASAANFYSSNKVTEFDLINQSGFKLYCDCKSQLEDFKPTANHQILFNYNDNVQYRPYPDDYIDTWDDAHVKLPCSSHNLDAKKAQKWPLIEKTLKKLSEDLKKHTDSVYIEYAIKSYNQEFKNKWSFGVLNSLFDEEFETSVSEDILKNLIPKIALLATQLPNLIKSPIRLLKANTNFSITMSKQQCACLLANAFFCTYPRRNNEDDEYDSYPFINFTQLYGTYETKRNKTTMKTKIEKLKCILNYFKRITDEISNGVTPKGLMTFTRQCIKNFPDFEKSTNKIRQAIIRYDGVIEDCKGATQLDFANKFVGGGVLNSGCVQEEIRFVICPELLVSLLFTEKLENNECLIIKGVEQYSSYTGYGETFRWKCDYKDDNNYDKWGRKDCELVAIDALLFRYPKSQFTEAKIIRELNKSYCGFYSNKFQHECSALATGNWGCGAFRGDRQLKFLIQLMSAAEAKRDMVYYTFKDAKLIDNLIKMQDIIAAKGLTVSNLYKILIEYNSHIQTLNEGQLKKTNICKFIVDKFTSS